MLTTVMADVARLLRVLASHLVPRPEETAEIYLRSRGAPGALVYTAGRSPAVILRAARATGATPYQLHALVLLLGGIPAVRRALKVGIDGGISLFAAIDFRAADLAALCGGVGQPDDGAMLAAAMHHAGWQPCGLALECPPAPGAGRTRLRVYAMCEAGELPARVGVASRQLAGEVEVDQQLLRRALAAGTTGPNTPIVVNLSAGGGQASVKVEIPQVQVDRIASLATSGQESHWARLVTATQRRWGGSDRLNYLGARWSPGRLELCGYVRTQALLRGEEIRRKP